MSAFDSIKGIFARLTSPVARPEDGTGIYMKNLTGVKVTPNSALTSSAVWGCIRYLTQTVAQVPWCVYQKGSTRRELTTHPTYWVLHNRVNPYMSSFQFREYMLACALINGNGYAEIERNGANQVIGLWPIAPERVSPQWSESGDLVYEVNNGTQGKVVLPADRVFHLRGLGNEVVGYAVIEYAAMTIGISLATDRFGAAFYGNSAMPSAVLEHPGKLTPEAHERLKKAMNDKHSGVEKTGSVMILQEGMTWKQMMIPPDHAQFLETRQFQVSEICRLFGVPPHKVADLDKATFSNIEHQSIEAVVDSITPWVKRFEDEADYKLFGQNRGNLYSKMNLNGLMRGDSKSRAEYYNLMRNMGVMNANEIRALEDMDSIGDEGDKYVIQMNMTTLERIGEDEMIDQSSNIAPVEEEDDEEDDAEPAVTPEQQAIYERAATFAMGVLSETKSD